MIKFQISTLDGLHMKYSSKNQNQQRIKKWKIECSVIFKSKIYDLDVITKLNFFFINIILFYKRTHKSH